jgi:hypothetical protein
MRLAKKLKDSDHPGSQLFSYPSAPTYRNDMNDVLSRVLNTHFPFKWGACWSLTRKDYIINHNRAVTYYKMSNKVATTSKLVHVLIYKCNTARI